MESPPNAYRPADWLESYKNFINKFLQISEIKYYKKGQLIDRPQGEAMKFLHLVLEGMIECSFQSLHGQKKISWLINNGLFIGMSSLDSYLEHHTFICRTPAIIASMPVEDIYKWDYDMFYSLVLMQTRKMRSARSQVISQHLESAQNKLIRLLLELGGEPRYISNQEIPLIVSVSRQELADIVGISREHTSKLIRNLQKRALLKISGKDIIFYPSKLKDLL